MRQLHDTELQQSETVAELINEPVSVGKQNGIGNNNVGRIAALAVAAIGILVIPIVTLLSGPGHLLPKLPIFIGPRGCHGESGQRRSASCARNEHQFYKNRVGRCSQMEIPQGRGRSRRNNGATIVCSEGNGSGHGCSMGTQGQERSGRRNAASGSACRRERAHFHGERAYPNCLTIGAPFRSAEHNQVARRSFP